MKEIYKDIKGYEGLYQVSNFGSVKSLSRKQSQKEKLLKFNHNKSGYNKFTLCVDSKVKCLSAHRLVATAFIPNPLNKPCVNHKNGIKTDNRVENLEWVTHSENVKHANKHNLINHPKGEGHYNSSLTEKQVFKIKNNYLNKGVTQRVIAKKFKIHFSTISDISLNKTWKHI